MSDESPEQAPAEAARARSIEIGWELRWGLWAIVILTIIQSFIARPFYIPSASMTPTLLIGDRIIVNKTAYGWSWVSPVPRVLPEFGGRLLGRLPKRGDVVVLKAPMRDADFIKRVIGLPGDTIEIRRGVMLVNDVAVDSGITGTTDIPVDINITCTEGRQRGRIAEDAKGRAVCRLPVRRETLPGGASFEIIDLGYDPRVDDMPRIRVPDGHVFLMGDNRDQSADSRVPISQGGLGGPVPVENLVGRAEIISFSLDGSTIAVAPTTWFSAMRDGRSWKWIRHGG
jgi:signal peptidase I